MGKFLAILSGEKNKIMSCLNAETHININSLVPSWSDDTGHSPSDKLLAHDWIPHCTHYPQISMPGRDSNKYSRQQMGIGEVCLIWSQDGKRKPHSQLFVWFSLKQIHHMENKIYQWVFSKSKRVPPKAQFCFVYVFETGLIYPRMASILLSAEDNLELLIPPVSPP